jgi:hypothetical protein
MKNRLIDNYVSSITGFAIIVTSVVLMSMKIIDTVSFVSLMTLAVGLLRAKDSIIPGVEAK